jgi:16S rRNA C1402 N4-methylase RsmH
MAKSKKQLDFDKLQQKIEIANKKYEQLQLKLQIANDTFTKAENILKELSDKCDVAFVELHITQNKLKELEERFWEAEGEDSNV